MDTYDRNVAIIGSAVYGGLLVIGMLLFVLGHSGEPFYRHPSVNVAIFSVFWFAFAPSVLFIGATVPWVCALCGSRAAALVFAVVPGGVFVLVGAYWIFLNDKYENFYDAFSAPLASPWSRNTVNLRYAPAEASYRTGDGVQHYPSPAAVAEAMNWETGGMSPFMQRPNRGSSGDGGGGGTPDFTNIAIAPPFVGSCRPTYVPAGAAVAYPPDGSSVPPLAQASSRNVATDFNYDPGGVDRRPQSAYSSLSPPLPTQTSSAGEYPHPPRLSGHYIA
ncbi:hypothetical protein ABB37_02794 [Leptomonas pyrrhocoris]|uniref:Transmembrane protein n=1 Tax=Leptomonas pyrrhocoris TaxID=157538 RepID=A0A0M9G681_LEPPY|nr:hypothetical protein ABB37_02794 [Leptomonas pyrrhocoris]XP_015661519.1 hypothetical protein ABB37_02794 [Leptomonas pyrrhocoris]KPA83079.1 hypothetical protein ABB37_02794 [Leptomonas pyrrhocoris]KPA83080.1 hypothetical protein ABB37_02794 [Leptomonas pyrrhocoris]|eukprot:XP_015661518.1 hypothetical protein ABB37_02794 [Leptomonas pyrrhocoris]